MQKPPFSTTPVQLERTDPQVKKVLSAREFDALTVTKTTRALVVQKSGFSEDEARLEEEALRNAIIEIEALSKTAAQAANEGAGKERRIRSEIEALRRTQEQRTEEAYNWRRATQEELWEEQTSCLGKETPPRVEGECEHAKEEAHRQGDDFIQRTGVDLQREDFAGVVTVQLPEEGIATFSEDLDIPADVIRRLNSDSSSERSVGLGDLARLGGENAFHIIARAFDEQSEDVRNAAARALFDLQPDRAASFARTLREGSPERRRRIAAALAASGLAGIAIGNLAGQTREKGYEAFSLLFLMAKAGEFQPLVRAVEDHPNIEVRLAVVKLLALNGQAEIVPSFRQLAVRGVLPSEVRAAVIEAIYGLAARSLGSFTSGATGQA